MPLTERQAIKIILARIRRDPKVLLPYGDDASAIPLDSRAAVLKADMLVRATDAPKGMTLRQMAMKAVTSTVSDLAAKGAKPVAFLVSLALPYGTTPTQVKELASGLDEAANLYGACILGGDVNEGPDFIIDCVALALADPGKLTPRNGAKPGDIIATTGFYGNPPAALKLVQEQPEIELTESMVERLKEALYEPRAHLKEGIALAGIASASIDSSDGLAWSIHEVARMSRVRAILTEIPISPEAIQFAEKTGLNPLNLALYGGEEYNIVATINPANWTKALEKVEDAGGELHRIGYVTRGRGIYLEEKNGEARMIKPRGWEHLRN
ncbi:MAG: thiamine-phosphate kinase [Candidatus Bathyarchaeia archaeon]